MDEARCFLALPRPCAPNSSRSSAARSGSPEAARRLFRAGRPIPGTPAEAYLRARGITGRLDWPALRYHPSVYYRETEHAPLEVWPALLAAVTDLDGTITGIQRTWLDPQPARQGAARRSAPGARPSARQRRALRHGRACPRASGDILAAGEGIETMLALKSVLPLLPMIAGLSANHLAALDLSPASAPSLCRPRQRRGRSQGGEPAARTGHAAGIDVRDLVPVHADFNLDLCRLGPVGHARASRGPARPVRPDAFPRSPRRSAARWRDRSHHPVSCRE